MRAFTCMCACVYMLCVYVCVCLFVCLNACMHLFVQVCACARLYACVCVTCIMYSCMDVCSCVSTPVVVYMYVIMSILSSCIVIHILFTRGCVVYLSM